MMKDNRLSGALHVLLHLAMQDSPVTSERLAQMLDTNPVVIRRLMSGLREQGYVRSEKGHGGGWTLDCDLTKVTLRDIFTALGSPSILALGSRNKIPACLIEQAVNAALGEAFHAAEALLLERFGDVTLAKLNADVRKRLASRSPHSHLEHAY
ncbi:MAG: Rrf2 family transcriptional regulator [Nitrospiraceae bacterium]